MATAVGVTMTSSPLANDTWKWRDGTDSVIVGAVGLQFVVILILLTALCCCVCRQSRRARRSYSIGGGGGGTNSSSHKPRTDKLELVVKRKSIENLDDTYSVVKIRGAYDLLQKVDEDRHAAAPGFLGNPTYMSNPASYAKLGDISESYNTSDEAQVGAVYCRLNEDCTHTHHVSDQQKQLVPPPQPPNHPLSKHKKYEDSKTTRQQKADNKVDMLQTINQPANTDDNENDDNRSEAHYSTVSLHSQDQDIYSLAHSPAGSKSSSSVDISSPAEYEEFYTVPETKVEEAPDSSSNCEKDPKQDTQDESKQKGKEHYGNIGTQLKLKVPPGPPKPKPRRPLSSMSSVGGASDQSPFHMELKRCVTNQ